MRKIVLEITTTTQTIAVEFNENIIDEQFIAEWSKYICDLKQLPDSVWMIDDIPKSEYPFINLAEGI